MNQTKTIETLREALEKCHPAKVWDLARQYYTGNRSFVIAEKHKELCKQADDAMLPIPQPDEQRVREASIADLLADLDERWSFGDGQEHTHSWHEKQDFLARWKGKVLSPLAYALVAEVNSKLASLAIDGRLALDVDTFCWIQQKLTAALALADTGADKLSQVVTWIPVGERLPELWSRVHLSLSDGSVCMGSRQGSGWEADDELDDDDAPTHWAEPLKSAAQLAHPQQKGDAHGS